MVAYEVSSQNLRSSFFNNNGVQLCLYGKRIRWLKCYGDKVTTVMQIEKKVKGVWTGHFSGKGNLKMSLGDENFHKMEKV